MRVALLVLVSASLALADGIADPPVKPITPAEREHWAFHPPRRPAVPAPKRAGWVRNPIDAFILRGIEEAGLEPTRETSRTSLLRRVTFDLTGLPPTPEEVDSFLRDERPGAYERVVDRVLASPRYGERWAQHWLDLARYADTDGFEFDQVRPNAWRYRDWVVDALNRDIPYDRFVRLQIAGDELEPDDPSAFVATGFNRCYPDMVDLNDQGLRRQNALNEITETTGLVLLGLTVGCARCHDHKFDPIRQADFYRLQAFFTPARFRDDYPIGRPEQRRAFESQMLTWESELDELQSAVIALETPLRSRLAPIPQGANDEVIVALQRPSAERGPRENTLIFEAQARDRRIRETAFRVSLGPALSGLRLWLKAHVETVRKAAPKASDQAMGLDESGSPIAPTYILRRGDYTSRGAVVGPAVPAVLVATNSSSVPIAPRGRSSGRRTALAEWLVDPANPLTTRVMVNRLWQGHLGRGIVATPSDFGTQGAPPSQPELLDWLATELPRRGWSLKAMHRLIVTSATYRQDSRASRETIAADPDNELVSHQNRKRLDGEAIRDAMLAASGKLDLASGGPCIFPELPAELTKLSGKGAMWPVSTREADRNRRSLYVFTRRNLRYPFFEVFDRPDTNASCPRRPVSTTAPQALSLLNGKLARDSSTALAARVGGEAREPSARVDRAYQLTLGRHPDPTERRLAEEFLSSGGASAFEDFCLALLNLNEFVYVD
ncbi:MAG TPA: DUF1549 and DUF1553 domain-containing protein [Isosphaeraceae bacterium]